MGRIVINEDLKKEIIKKDKQFIYDEMEDETGMNVLECEGGMASLGTSPTPGLARTSAATVNGKAVPSKSYKKKSLKECIQDLNNLLDSLA